VTPLAGGVWGVLATPFRGPELDVDHDSLARLAVHYRDCGATGLTVLGVFGEAARLTTTERAEVLRTVAGAVDLPLVVGVTALSTRPVVEEVGVAADVLADRMAAAMVQVNSQRPDVLAAHLSAVHAATGAGLVVQDYPVASGVPVPVPALVRALRDAGGVVAVKAEAAPVTTAVATLTGELGLPVFGGLGGIGLVDELALGASGAMTGFSYPEGLVAAVDAWRAGGFEAARRAFQPYLPLVCFEQQPGIALAIRKRCLVERGLVDEAGVRPPAPSLPASLEAPLLAHLSAVEKETAR